MVYGMISARMTNLLQTDNKATGCNNYITNETCCRFICFSRKAAKMQRKNFSNGKPFLPQTNSLAS